MPAYPIAPSALAAAALLAFATAACDNPTAAKPPAPKFLLTLAMTGSGTGAVTAAPVQEFYDSATVVLVTATPAAGSVFTGWFEGCADQSNPCSVAMTTRRFLTATFHTFTLQSSGSGTGTATIAHPVATDPSQITVTAVPASGSNFVGWRGDLCRQPVNPCTIFMTKATTVPALFTAAAGAARFDGDYVGTITPADVNGGSLPLSLTSSGGTLSGRSVSGTSLTGSVSEGGALSATMPAHGCTYHLTGTITTSLVNGITTATGSGTWTKTTSPSCQGAEVAPLSGAWGVSRSVVEPGGG